MNQTVQNEINTRNARIWVDVEGILRVVYSSGSEITLEDVVIINNAIKEICGDKKHPCFVDPGKHKSINREAREFSIIHTPEVLTACAVLITSPLTQIVVNFLVGLNKLINKESVLYRAFKSENKAIEWLKRFRT